MNRFESGGTCAKRMFWKGGITVLLIDLDKLLSPPIRFPDWQDPRLLEGSVQELINSWPIMSSLIESRPCLDVETIEEEV